MNKFLTVACAATLLSTTAFAGEKQVEVKVPKTLTVTCSDNVQPGTVVLSNPPKLSCADYDVVNRVIGTGITVGPDTKVSQILHAVRRMETPSRTVVRNESRQELWVPPVQNSSRQSLDDFDKRFPGFSRNQTWFENTDRELLTRRSETENCSGWVSLSDVINGKCGDARIRVERPTTARRFN